MILHVFAQPGDELKSLFKEQLRERCGKVATIAEQLAAQPFHQVGNRGSIIDVACSQTAGQQLASTTLGQVQQTAKEPAHARHGPSSIRGKDAVSTDADGITDAASRSSR